MKYIKKYNEELDVKRALLGGALAATMIGTSCKKDDIFPIQPEKIEVDSTKVDDVTDSENKKSNLYNFVDAVNKISIKKEEPVKTQSKKSKRINKFKDFIKSKFKKS